MIRVLQFSTHNEDCGIAKYQARFVKAFAEDADMSTEFFEFSPNTTKLMSPKQFNKVLTSLARKLQDFDILHIQHELSFFYNDELQKIIRLAKQNNKKVIVTVHTAPEAQMVVPHLGGIGPRSLAHFVRQKASQKRFLNKYVSPLNRADRIIVHNEATRQNLVKYGITESAITVIRHPVPVVSFSQKSDQIKRELGYKKGDVIIASVGFLSAAKGVLHAVRALTYLPSYYKLAIIGGIHPDAQDTTFLDEVADQIRDLSLQERVYITGYIKDDNELDALVREVDICVFPFDKRYYSFVSSGSLNIAISNHKPVVAYHTPSFDETNAELEVVSFCKSPNYYELARTIKSLDVPPDTHNVRKYAELYDWNSEAGKFKQLYADLIDS